MPPKTRKADWQSNHLKNVPEDYKYNTIVFYTGIPWHDDNPLTQSE